MTELAWYARCTLCGGGVIINVETPRSEMSLAFGADPHYEVTRRYVNDWPPKWAEGEPSRWDSEPLPHPCPDVYRISRPYDPERDMAHPSIERFVLEPFPTRADR